MLPMPKGLLLQGKKVATAFRAYRVLRVLRVWRVCKMRYQQLLGLLGNRDKGSAQGPDPQLMFRGLAMS
jgi:hypothetical protein